MRLDLFILAFLFLFPSHGWSEEFPFQEIYRKRHEYVHLYQLEGSVSVYEVNSHQWVLPAWLDAKSKSLESWPEAVSLVHVDSHPDMGPGRVVQDPFLVTIQERMGEYGSGARSIFSEVGRHLSGPRGHIGISRFISPGVHFFAFPQLVWLTPGFNEKPAIPYGVHLLEWVYELTPSNMEDGGVESFEDVHFQGFDLDYPFVGRNVDEGMYDWIAGIENRKIQNEKKIQLISSTFFPHVSSDVAFVQGPYILDIDMDSFSCLNPGKAKGHPKKKLTSERKIQPYVKAFRDYLNQLDHPPLMITMATSEGWRDHGGKLKEGYTPQKAVPIIRRLLLKELQTWLQAFQATPPTQ